MADHCHESRTTRSFFRSPFHGRQGSPDDHTNQEPPPTPRFDMRTPDRIAPEQYGLHHYFMSMISLFPAPPELVLVVDGRSVGGNCSPHPGAADRRTTLTGGTAGQSDRHSRPVRLRIRSADSGPDARTDRCPGDRRRPSARGADR